MLRKRVGESWLGLFICGWYQMFQITNKHLAVKYHYPWRWCWWTQRFVHLKNLQFILFVIFYNIVKFLLAILNVG